MNGDVINSFIERISKTNGTAEEELKILIEEGKITREEAAMIHLRASLLKMDSSLKSALEKVSI